MTAGAPLDVSVPLPQPPAYNLLATVPVTTAADGGPPPRWLNGATAWGYPPADGFAWDPCSTGTLRSKEEGEGPPGPTFSSFVAYLPGTCSSLSVGANPEEFARRVLAAFAARESAIVEAELASGDAVGPDGNPYLADGNATVLAAAAVGPMEGLARIEEAIGGTREAGVIYAPPGIATAWNCCYLLYRDGQTLRTVARNTPVVVGDGFIGAFPEDAPGDIGSPPTGDQEWAWATTGINVYRTEARLNPAASEIFAALDRGSNVVTYRAERDYLYVYESPSDAWAGGLQAAVLIDRSS